MHFNLVVFYSIFNNDLLLNIEAGKQTVSKIKSAPFIWTALAIVFELHIVGYL